MSYFMAEAEAEAEVLLSAVCVMMDPPRVVRIQESSGGGDCLMRDA
jgi:hypothetical protein